MTYNMNRLQTLDAEATYCVTLNATGDDRPGRDPPPDAVQPPVFDRTSLQAQKRRGEISGSFLRTHYCGAYWGFGFHEDGVRSAVEVARALGADL